MNTCRARSGSVEISPKRITMVTTAPDSVYIYIYIYIYTHTQSPWLTRQWHTRHRTNVGFFVPVLRLFSFFFGGVELRLTTDLNIRVIKNVSPWFNFHEQWQGGLQQFWKGQFLLGTCSQTARYLWFQSTNKTKIIVLLMLMFVV